jgi:hypothetical protein
MQQQNSVGDEIRKIANRLQEEQISQIKATSQILGAAAQISKNHDQLIDEVVQVIEEDLIQSSRKDVWTIEILKKKFRTLREAKLYFGLKARSWENLVQSLNTMPNNSNFFGNSINASIIKRLDLMEEEIQTIHAEIRQILSLLAQTHLQ